MVGLKGFHRNVNLVAYGEFLWGDWCGSGSVVQDNSDHGTSKEPMNLMDLSVPLMHHDPDCPKGTHSQKIITDNTFFVTLRQIQKHHSSVYRLRSCILGLFGRFINPVGKYLFEAGS